MPTYPRALVKFFSDGQDTIAMRPRFSDMRETETPYACLVEHTLMSIASMKEFHLAGENGVEKWRYGGFHVWTVAMSVNVGEDSEVEGTSTMAGGGGRRSRRQHGRANFDLGGCRGDTKHSFLSQVETLLRQRGT